MNIFQKWLQSSRVLGLLQAAALELQVSGDPQTHPRTLCPPQREAVKKDIVKYPPSSRRRPSCDNQRRPAHTWTTTTKIGLATNAHRTER